MGNPFKESHDILLKDQTDMSNFESHRSESSVPISPHNNNENSIIMNPNN